MMKTEVLSIEERSKTKNKSESKQNLPYLSTDIVRLIMGKLPWTERLRLSLVCKSWKELFDEIQDTEEFLPWVMCFDWDTKSNGGTCKLCDPSTQTSHTVKEPTTRTERELFHNAFFRDSKFGWLLFSNPLYCKSKFCETFFLYSPFKNEIIKFPELENECYSAAFSSHPGSPDCMVIVLFSLPGKLQIKTCSPGDDSWKTFEFSGEYDDVLTNVVHVGEHFYCLFTDGKLGAFNIKQQQWKLISEQLPETKGYTHMPFLCVAYNGDLIKPYWQFEAPHKGWRFWRFDLSEKKWVDVEDAMIEKQAIFLHTSVGAASSLSVRGLGNARESVGKMHYFCSDTCRCIPWYYSIFDQGQSNDNEYWWVECEPAKVYGWLKDNNLQKIWIQPPFLKSFESI